MLWQKHKVEKFEAEEKKKVGVMQNGDMPLKKKKKPGASPRNQGEGQRKNVAERKDDGVQKESGVGKGVEPRAIDYRFTPCLESFHCAHCGKEIHPEGAGSQHRNHCPHCLYSLHVDEEPGDRKATCHGQMEPIGVISKRDGDWSILHLCKSCGKLSLNRALADDNPLLLMQLAVKPLSSPPFPMSFLSHYLEEQGK